MIALLVMHPTMLTVDLLNIVVIINVMFALEPQETTA